MVEQSLISQNRCTAAHIHTNFHSHTHTYSSKHYICMHFREDKRDKVRHEWPLNFLLRQHGDDIYSVFQKSPSLSLSWTLSFKLSFFLPLLQHAYRVLRTMALFYFKKLQRLSYSKQASVTSSEVPRYNISYLDVPRVSARPAAWNRTRTIPGSLPFLVKHFKIIPLPSRCIWDDARYEWWKRKSKWWNQKWRLC